MAQQDRVDVVTVGAGWTAGILAQQLTAAGLRVLSLEQGPWRITEEDFSHNHDELRYQVRRHMMVDLQRETWTWRPTPGDTALPMRQYGSFNPGQGVGGAGVHWAGQSWRFYPSDFQYRTHHIDRYGLDRLPAGNRIQDWPITYDELEPYYDAWEYDVGVSGKAGNIQGEQIEGGNVFEGPRQREYPLPPLQNSITALRFTEAANELGYHPFPQPAGILSEAYEALAGNTRGGCFYCEFCTRYSCEVAAKASSLVTHIPAALATGNYEIRTDDWKENDYKLIRYLSPKMREILEQMGAQNVTTQEELQPYSIAPYQSTHNTGGAIMGTDPSNSVTNKYGQVWDTPNVFVTGAALFPQNPGMNPTETVCALAYLAGDGIINEYVNSPGEIIGSA